VTEDAPSFARHFQKNKVIWHRPEIFAKDYELGEMGTTARRGARSVNEYRYVQQGFLEGKMVKRAAATRHTHAGLISALKISGYVEHARALGTPTDYSARISKDLQVDALKTVGTIDHALQKSPMAFDNHMSVGAGDGAEYKTAWRQKISGNPEVARITGSDPRIHFLINDGAVEHRDSGVYTFERVLKKLANHEDAGVAADSKDSAQKYFKLYGREKNANGHADQGKLHDPRLIGSDFVRYALAQNGYLPGGLEKLPVKPVWEENYPSRATKWADNARELIKEGAFDIWDLTDPNKKISFAGEMDYARHDGSFEHHEKLTPFISSYHHNFAQHGAIISDNASAEEVQTLLSAVEMERKRRGQG
jgi:hypothetical protein